MIGVLGDDTDPMVTVMKLEKATQLFLSLGQEDGRVKSKGEDPFPFTKYIYPLSVSVFELNKGQKKLEVFSPSQMKNKPFIKNYRDVQLDLNLEKGTYVIIPSTKISGSLGKFYLNVYYNCPKSKISITHLDEEFDGETIEEEEDSQIQIDQDIKKLLKTFINEFIPIK